MSTTPRLAGLAAALAIALLVACDSPSPTSSTSPVPPSRAQLAAAAELPPFPDPADFVAEIDNPYFPLSVGTVFAYRAGT
ncbi:MAG TPA: hypothetical protein VE173_13360, partial [Longimicrobiales bacterium]|nr:hypothetical protein [Longimicrobiales bacterium]